MCHMLKLIHFNGNMGSACLLKLIQKTEIQFIETYIIEDDGGIAVAQFANLPPRLFYVLFGQASEEETGRKQQMWDKWGDFCSLIVVSK